MYGLQKTAVKATLKIEPSQKFKKELMKHLPTMKKDVMRRLVGLSLLTGVTGGTTSAITHRLMPKGREKNASQNILVKEAFIQGLARGFGQAARGAKNIGSAVVQKTKAVGQNVAKSMQDVKQSAKASVAKAGLGMKVKARQLKNEFKAGYTGKNTMTDPKKLQSQIKREEAQKLNAKKQAPVKEQMIQNRAARGAPPVQPKVEKTNKMLKQEYVQKQKAKEMANPKPKPSKEPAQTGPINPTGSNINAQPSNGFLATVKEHWNKLPENARETAKAVGYGGVGAGALYGGSKMLASPAYDYQPAPYPTY